MVDKRVDWAKNHDRNCRIEHIACDGGQEVRER